MSGQSTCGINFGIISAAVANESTMPCKGESRSRSSSTILGCPFLILMFLPFFISAADLQFGEIRKKNTARFVNWVVCDINLNRIHLDKLKENNQKRKEGKISK